MRTLAIACLAAALGCGLDNPGDGFEPCEGSSCGAQSKDELLAALDGFSDPFAEVLRREVSDDGTLIGDYQTVLDGTRQEMGCSISEERSFVVLSNLGLIPKVIFTECSDQPNQASRFFMAAPSISEGPDIDPLRLHVASWDADAGLYRTYATVPDASGALRIRAEPQVCLGCHGGPEVLGTWQPLMNEMTNPWTQWNAEPGFSSHHFDSDLDRGFEEGVVYREMLSGQRLASASDLEPLVRAGIERVSDARVDTRHNPADLEESLALLRPLYCDESINYTSEIHRSGELRSAGIVDDSLRSLLSSLRPGQWSFADEDRFRLPLPDNDDDTVVLLPVRGESTTAIERGLLSRRILTPIDVLRVRAIDYQRPVGSAARCNLFRGGAEQLRARAEELLSGLPAEADNAALVPILYQQLMSSLGLLTGDDDVFAVPSSDDPAYKAGIQSGEFSSFKRTVDELGTTIANRLDNVSRGDLLDDRDQRACDAQDVYPTAPLVPGLNCP